MRYSRTLRAVRFVKWNAACSALRALVRRYVAEESRLGATGPLEEQHGEMFFLRPGESAMFQKDLPHLPCSPFKVSIPHGQNWGMRLCLWWAPSQRAFRFREPTCVMVCGLLLPSHQPSATRCRRSRGGKTGE